MGFFVAEPAHREGRLPDIVGPTVYLRPCTEESWSACIFVASRHRSLSIHYDTGSNEVKELPVDIMESCGEWFFMRFVFNAIRVRDDAQIVTYTIVGGSQDVGGRIPVAGKRDEWNIVAYSCYDQRRAIGEKLWEDISGIVFSGCVIGRVA
jgi:hypothetical protein